MRTQLFLSTVAFAIAFAVWGSIAGAAPLLKKLWGLTSFETALLVALPVILGSVGRIPMGILTDRLGSRCTMVCTLILSGLCAITIALSNPDYPTLLGLGALLGISGTTFVIGVAHIAPWYPGNQQGSALGIFGMGNMGQSLALLGIPWFASIGSWKVGFIFLGLLCLAWSAVFFMKAQESPKAIYRRKSLTEAVEFFTRSPMAWVLSTYYFMTFGGFIAMSIYLPMLLRDQFLLLPQKAGMETACFVILATLMRPLGGFLSDRSGAERILFFVFLSLSGLSFLLMRREIGFFTFGVLGFAVAVGLGNGAVLKLVPHYFPKEIGTVTGLVGAVGGMGGFFPPLVMGFSWQTYGNYFAGWLGLLIFSITCTAILCRTSFRNRKGAASRLAKEGIVIL